MSSAVAFQDHDQSWAADIAAAISRKFQNEARSALQRGLPQYVADNVSDTLQNPSPSSPEQHGGESMSRSIGTNPKTFGTSADPKSETRTSLHRALTLHVSDPAKIVARKTGASIDTIDNHRSGNVPQSWAQLIAYCRAYPAFGLEVLEMIGIDIDRDRESYALFLALQRTVRGA